MSDETTNSPMELIPNAPQGRCVICDDHLGLSASESRRAVYAGSNPDGTGRLAHRNCWQNMRNQIWLSYGVSLDDLSDREFSYRQAERPKLGDRPRLGSFPRGLQHTLIEERHEAIERAENSEAITAQLRQERDRTYAYLNTIQEKLEGWKDRADKLDEMIKIQLTDGN